MVLARRPKLARRKKRAPFKPFKPLKAVRSKPRIVVHVAGASGAGKTTLGKRLKRRFGTKIVVKDLDDLRTEYIAKKYKTARWSWADFDAKGYQVFLDQYIAKIRKPLVLVGLNHIFFHDKKLYYNVHATHRFYIDIPDMQVVKQKCLRYITDELQDVVKMENVVDDITNNNKKFVKLINEGLVRECGVKQTTKLNAMWKRGYGKQNYTFLSHARIFDRVAALLQRTILH